MTARIVLKIPSVTIILALFLAAAPLFAQQSSQRNTEPLADKRVLVISIDGMRPDVLLRAKAPNIREMTQHGSFTFWAESTDMAITLPTHVSMFTGVSPAKHHITWNDDRRVESGALTVPTLFDLVKKAGHSTAMVVGKTKLCIIAGSGMADCRKSTVNNKEDSLSIANRAAEVLRRHRPHVMFVHFPDPDTVGHALGWGSPEQVIAAGSADQGSGRIMAAQE